MPVVKPSPQQASHQNQSCSWSSSLSYLLLLGLLLGRVLGLLLVLLRLGRSWSFLLLCFFMAGVQNRTRVVPAAAAGVIRTPPAGGLTAKETVDLRPKGDSGTRESPVRIPVPMSPQTHKTISPTDAVVEAVMLQHDRTAPRLHQLMMPRARLPPPRRGRDC